MHVNRFDVSSVEFTTELTVADQRHINKAIKAAGESKHRYRVGAVIVVSNRVTSETNRLRNASTVAPYAEQSVHAEIRALSRAFKRGRGGTMYIARLGAKGALLASHPCRRCIPSLRDAGVKRIVWWNGATWVASKLQHIVV